MRGTEAVPVWEVRPAPESWGPTALGPDPVWRTVAPLPPFELADGSGPAKEQTSVRLVWDPEALWIRFDCEDKDAWSTFQRRDDPLWEEEAVEVFLAAGEDVPKRYFELQISPLGVLFDAVVDNPRGDRRGMVTDPAWDCEGIHWAAGPAALRQDWWAVVRLPWSGLLPANQPRPSIWRANFFRIERPRRRPDELSAWSSPGTDPPDFHRPERFGSLRLVAPDRWRQW
ncbi:MAG: carbohydrate-binding family 9-like protein [Acidobacteriota bacterium]